MDDLSEKLTGILNDPESMERVKQMAESILGGGKAEPPAPSAVTGLADIGDALGGEDIGKIGYIENENGGKRQPRSAYIRAKAAFKRRAAGACRYRR